MNRMGQWFADTRVRNKILVGYGIMLLLMLLMGLIVFAQATRITAANDENRRIEGVLAGTQRISESFANLASSLRDYAITGQASALEIYESAREDLTLAIEQTRAGIRDPEQMERLGRIVESSQLWQDSVAGVVIPLRAATLRPGGPPLQTVVDFYQRGTAREYVRETGELLDAMGARERILSEESRLAVDDALRSMRWAAILFTLLAALLAAVVSVWIAAQISRPLGSAVSLASAVASGDLTQQAPPGGRDEVGLMISRLNAMASDLRQTVAGVSAASGQVASAAEQIATASEEISYTSDQQVRATEDTSSSMEEIASQIVRVARSAESLAVSVEQISSSIGQMSNSVEQTAASTESLGASVEQTSATIEEMAASISEAGRHVEETRRIARDAEANASAGGGAVGRAVESMQRIHGEMDEMVSTIRQLGATSESIGLISETIEGIADQTNLLALNAAIEAARAGEHGRGFAVVAQEIRRLAERAVESTREISTTIRGVREEIGRVITSTGGVAERTREGIEVADTAGQALEKIIDSAGRTRGLMEEVALATQQQIGAAEQAQEAIRHIQRVSGEVRLATREQAIGSRQIVEAVENMSRQTQEVFAATAEQKRGGEMILASTENISEGARSTQAAIQEMTNAAQELSSQAMRLTELVKTFRV